MLYNKFIKKVFYIILKINKYLHFLYFNFIIINKNNKKNIYLNYIIIIYNLKKIIMIFHSLIIKIFKKIDRIKKLKIIKKEN